MLLLKMWELKMVLKGSLLVDENGCFEELAAMFFGSCLVVGRGGGGWVLQYPRYF